MSSMARDLGFDLPESMKEGARNGIPKGIVHHDSLWFNEAMGWTVFAISSVIMVLAITSVILLEELKTRGHAALDRDQRADPDNVAQDLRDVFTAVGVDALPLVYFLIAAIAVIWILVLAQSIVNTMRRNRLALNMPL